MMENSGIYNVIWIDDKYEEIDLLGNAEQDNIYITWKFLRKVTRSFSFESDPPFLSKVTRLS